MKLHLLPTACLAIALAVTGCAHGRSKPSPCAKPRPTPEAQILKTAYVEPMVVDVPVAAPVDVPAPAKGHYMVRKGDSLWKIAGKQQVLGDSMLWPIIYEDNRDQITDPDLIEVKQDLVYRQRIDEVEREEALQKAKDTPLYVPHTMVRHPLPLKY
jgi:hypothetical protein